LLPRSSTVLYILSFLAALHDDLLSLLINVMDDDNCQRVMEVSWVNLTIYET